VGCSCSPFYTTKEKTMAKEKVKHLSGVLASVFAQAGHITKEEAKEISGLADHEFEKAYNAAAKITEKTIQTVVKMIRTIHCYIGNSLVALKVCP
jgi:ElaB/YqjD/DUF883 family membrane-anchored ribosome-binding protein